jgi:hypothetical protein
MTAAETASTTTEAVSFIDTELRGAAMKLHTRAQAPREGQAEVVATPAAAPYVTTHADYLRFLVDSQHVYQAFEEVVGSKDELKAFRNTGLERVAVLEEDIAWMTDAFDLERPAVGSLGQDYAALLRDKTLSTPALVCHFYNFYFAHTAGGRMIGECYKYVYRMEACGVTVVGRRTASPVVRPMDFLLTFCFSHTIHSYLTRTS